jgi:hypothetical protein
MPTIADVVPGVEHIMLTPTREQVIFFMRKKEAS